MRSGLKYMNAMQKCLFRVSAPLTKLHLVPVDILPFKWPLKGKRHKRELQILFWVLFEKENVFLYRTQPSQKYLLAKGHRSK